jgi:subtilisin family serine protease
MRMILNALFLLLSLQSVVGADVAYHPSRVIVGTNFYETGNLDISSLETTYGVKVARYIGSDMLVMNIEDQVKVDDKIKALKDSSLFRFVEPDYKTTPMYQDGTGSPNLYGMDKISMPCVWSKITNGTANTRVCVIDTGVDYKHTDLVANIWVNPWENKIGMGVDNDKNGYVDDVYGINAITNKGNATDDHYHGTHVSGTIGAVRNDKGVIGVAPKVDIIPCKFLSSSGSGYYSDAIQCIEYCKAIFDKYRSMDATKHQYTGIYSNSWGGSGFSQALYDSIKKLETGSTQSLFIAAAGNSASNSDVTPMYPAAYDLNNIVSVAATDSNDNLASF